MKVFIAHILLIIFGAGLSVISPEKLGFAFASGGAEGTARWWMQSFQLFAIPMCLVIVQFWAARLAAAFGLVWGLWLVFWATGMGFSDGSWLSDWPAGIVVGFSGVLGLSLVVFHAIRLTKPVNSKNE